jgi:hypothetical protein
MTYLLFRIFRIALSIFFVSTALENQRKKIESAILKESLKL